MTLIKGLSKTETRKPNIYIATGMTGESSLDVAESILYSPFIGMIFTLEGLIKKKEIPYLPDPKLIDVGTSMRMELELADIFILDNRHTELPETSYAVHSGKKLIVYNPNDNPLPLFIRGTEYKVLTSLQELEDFNYLKYNK